MNCRLIQSVLITVALLLSAGSLYAAETKAGAGGETKAINGSKAPEKGAKAKAAKAAGKIKLVDINSASKAELKTLPGISDDYADKIIAGRPYLSKADLTTRKVIPAGPYQRIRSRVIAKPNEATAAKLSEMQKKGH